MLDYDSMRAKVKKLVEKPDKDPSKLPRTEKEAEMVIDASTFFRTSTLFQELDASFTASDLTLPSPPKVLDGLKRNRDLDRLRANEEAAMQSVGIIRRSSILDRVSRASSLVMKSWSNASPTEASPERDSLELMLPQATPSQTPTRRSGAKTQRVDDGSPSLRLGSKTTALEERSPARYASMPLSHNYAATPRSSVPTSRKTKIRSSEESSLRVRSPTSSEKTVTPATVKKSTESSRMTRTPFFNPSELEDIMQPFKARFIEEQADELEQAKAAYEQLNQQLTDELPQLIDLR